MTDYCCVDLFLDVNRFTALLQSFFSAADAPKSLVSISIDENYDNWARARSQEQMPWTQFIVDKDKIDLVSQQFNFSAIPMVLFVDKDGYELEKFTGFEKANDKTYLATIDKYIK